MDVWGKILEGSFWIDIIKHTGTQFSLMAVHQFFWWYTFSSVCLHFIILDCVRSKVCSGRSAQLLINVACVHSADVTFLALREVLAFHD